MIDLKNIEENKNLLKIVFFLSFFYGTWIIFKYEFNFLDNINLIIHEAGHIIFMPFGEIIYFLGGTILQLLLPLAVAYTFYYKEKKIIETYISLLWFSESLSYMAYYMADAQKQKLPLVGGNIHDWNFLFKKAKVLNYSYEIALFFHILASLLIVFILYKLFKKAF